MNKRPSMNRRAFVQTGILALGAAAMPPASRAAPLALKIKKAVKLDMVHEKLSVADTFKLLQDLGFDGVEVYTRDRAETAAYRKAIETTSFPVHGVVNSSDPNIADAVEMAAALGADSALVVAAHDPKRSFAENVHQWQTLVGAALPLAEKKKVRLLIENVRATFLKTGEEMARFIDSFESPWVGAYYDTGNTITWTEQSAEHWARVLGKRIGKIDIKDRGHQEFGDAKQARAGIIGTDGGEVNWAEVRAALAALNYNGWATAEVKGGDRQRLARMAQWMNRVLGIS